MSKICNVCGSEFESPIEAKQCSPECRREHASKYVTKESDTPYDWRQVPYNPSRKGSFRRE